MDIYEGIVLKHITTGILVKVINIDSSYVIGVLIEYDSPKDIGTVKFDYSTIIIIGKHAFKRPSTYKHKYSGQRYSVLEVKLMLKRIDKSWKVCKTATTLYGEAR